MPIRLRRDLCLFFLCLCISIGAPSNPDAQQDEIEIEEQGTGAQPISPEEFAILPKTPEYRAFLPERADLSWNFPNPGSQGSQGSCVGWAVGYAARSYYANVAESRNTHDISNIPSPSYIYNSIISISQNCKTGSSIVDALNLLKSKGALSLKKFPYDPFQCVRPTAEQRSQAMDFKIERWLAVNYASNDQVKGEIAKGHPIIISIRSSDQLHKLKRGTVYNIVGGQENRWHALPVVGYDETRQAFKVMNSWGARWGDGGFGWISYESFRSEVREAYVMRPLKPVAPERKETPTPNTPVTQIKPPIPSPTPVVPIVPDPIPAPAPMVIADVECGRVVVNLSGKKRMFTGFVSSDEDLTRLTNRAKAENAEIDIAVRPWPQCEVLLTLDKAVTAADRPSVKIESSGKAMQTDDFLRITVKSPRYPSFLHAAYIQADGSVVHLIQPDSAHLKAVPASSTLTFGSFGATGPQFQIAPPYGREMVVVIASRSPLFAAPRPQQETEREFLTALRKALVAKLDPSAPDRMVSAEYEAIRTSDATVIRKGGTQP